MNGAGSFTVDLGQLQSAVDDLDAYDRFLEQRLDHLEAVTAQLQSVWQGAAAEAHAAAHRKWADGAAEMRAAVQRMRAVVATAHANHSGAQEANMRIWEQFA